MRSIFGVLLSLAIAIACSESPQAQPLEPVAPVYMDGPDSSIALVDWIASPVPHAPNRIVFRERGYRFARMLTIMEKSTHEDQFEQTVRTALSKESVTNLKFIKVKDIDGPIAEAFRREQAIPDGIFRAWIVSGKSDGKNIKGAGFSIITAEAASGPGTSLEVFLAETDEYEHMGGIMVPLARLFKVGLTNPEADLLSTGRAPDDEAIDAMVTQFEQFMVNIIRGKILNGIAQQQTLSIMQGLDQAQDYGLQDPVYDLGN